MIHRLIFAVVFTSFLSGPIAHAELYSLYTKDLAVSPGTGTTVSSSFGLNINVAGFLALPGPANQPPAILTGLLLSSLSGSGVVDMNLDSSNSGWLRIDQLTLNLADVSYNQSGLLLGFSPYSFHVSFKGIKLELHASNIFATNGAFIISPTTTGSLALVDGWIEYDISIPALGVEETGSIGFFGEDREFTLNFSDPSIGSISGTVDDDGGGSDDGSPDGSTHGRGAPGLTGLSNIDTDGAEINLSLQGLKITSALDLSGTTLPITIGLGGNISVSVPEAGSMALVGLAGVASLAVVRMRRRNG